MMTSDGDTSYFSRLFANKEFHFACLCFVFVVTTHSVDGVGSFSELLSDMDWESANRASQPLTDYIDGDGTTAQISDDESLAPKRTPWAPYEVNFEVLRHKIRSKAYQNRQKYGNSKYGSGSAFWAGRDEGRDGSELSSTKAFVDGYMTGWLGAQAHYARNEESGGLLMQRSFRRMPDEDDLVDMALRKLEKRGEGEEEGMSRVRSTSGVHPVYLGMGQDMANAALSTFANLLAEEEKRKNPELPSSPVRFIGKRYSTDE